MAAWNTIEVPMITKPKRGSMVGEKKRYDITVTAVTGEVNPQTVNCELHHNPFIGSWRPIMRVLRAIFVLALLGVAIYYLIQWGGGWSVLTGDFPRWIGNIVHNVERILPVR